MMSHQLLSPKLAKLAVAALLPLACAAFAQNAAVVNNKPISKQRVDEFVQNLVSQGRPDTPELRAAVRDELIARELFVQEAERKGLQRGADAQRQLAAAREDILIRATIQDYLKNNPVKDDEVKAEYDRLAKQSGDKEYRARHILVEKEEDAKKIIEDLKKGAKFEDLAKQSKDTGSAQSGGDLDWNTPQTFVKEFSEAMVALGKGNTTQEPVRSQFGYHVIRVDDVRDVQPPPLEQVGPQIKQQIERQRLQRLQQELRAKAKIQ
ncbi:MAG: peptidylprolyl isomerase [Burkholderiales bacterium]|nr:peptidylprolyl isomerase [Burkholderiales bacterium]